MPLPTNGSFPVLGYSRPGEAVHSKPKRAIVVRMSPETLDALKDFPNNPPMEFEFGDNPRIYIGDQRFTLNPAPESSPHDLYLRASSATKKNPPFKLHANIIGKLTVQRELVPGVGERVRESTTEALAQRANRTTKMIEDPKQLIAGTQRARKDAKQSQRKKKADGAAGMAASSSRSSGSSLVDKAKNKAVASAARTGTVKATPNPLDRLSPERAQDLRRRLIHFLATEERSEDEVVRGLGGSNATSQSREVICHVLEDVGEPIGKPGSKYRLKPRSWKEVRPNEWEKWGDSVRMKICREGRMKLTSMGISETDPLWAHFVLRRPNNNHGLAPSSFSAQAAERRGTPEPRRPLMSSDYREKEREKAAATRAKGKAEIMAKDESRNTHGPGRESPSNMSRMASSSSSSTASARKQPGSGFKVTSSKLSNDMTKETTPSRKTDMRPPATTGRDSPSASSVSSTTQASRVAQRNRERAGSVQDSDTERKRASHVNQSSKLGQRTKVEDDYQNSDVERRRQQRQAEREREREQREKDKEREWGREKEKERQMERRDREREKERRERERERARESDREHGRDTGREREKRESERARGNGRDRDSEREREQEKLSRLKDVKREREEGETSDASVASAFKRKARPVEDDEEYQPSKSSQKRRKTEPSPARLPPKPKLDASHYRHERSYSRQSDLSDLKIKREPSPLPPHRTSSSSHKRPRSPGPPAPNKRPALAPSRDTDRDSTRSGSAKPKKNYKQANSDMIYTDSSDSERDTKGRHKDELPQPRSMSTAQRRGNPLDTLPELPIDPTKLAPRNGPDHEQSGARNTLTPLHSNGNGRISSHTSSKPHERLASLQKDYNKKFYPYDELWRAMDAQHRAVKGLWKKLKSGSESVSEEDDPIMDLGELERGVSKLKRMAEELVPLDREIKRLRDQCGPGGSLD